MKRLNNIFNSICSIENLMAADAIARKGKKGQYGIRLHDKNKEQNISVLSQSLLNKGYTTSKYSVFKIYDPKERDVFRLPYYPDRIVHHAIMRKLEKVFVSTFTVDTYSCIKGRGIHAAANAVKFSLRDVEGTTYCLKLDIRKFYPSINHEILKSLLRRKIKDADLLWLLDEIIDSAEGVPIGNYLSQYFANFYLSYFDHWVKEVKRVKYYFRYADDLVFLSENKELLHQLLYDIREYLTTELKLTIKHNYQIFPISARGIDFVGYVFFHTHTRLRKGIKQRFARMLHSRNNPASIASYWGWLKHCDSKHLAKKYYMEKKRFSEFGIKPVLKGLIGDKIKIGKVLNREIEVVDFRIDDSKYGSGGSKCLCIQIKLDGVDRVVFTGSKVLMETIEQIPKNTGFPFITTIIEENERYEFT